MSQRKYNAQATRASILEAARRLFARQDISAVSIRDIAKEAGVSHGLVQQYFGTREHMIAGIIEHEIEEVAKRIPAIQKGKAKEAVASLRDIKSGMARFQDYALLIMRAELTGVKPETMLDPAKPTPAMALAAAIAELQANAPKKSKKKLDPRLVSAYINAALFAFAALSPWLMASVGLKPKDFQAKLDEIADISVRLAALATGETDQ
ncbi:MAG: TetR/AcrR family transcriptional regulator [Planctomycetaceae bacterium]|nr:TetR/AcrR family transcriptional regulator [Planctomycetaceae bacterium]